MSQNKFTGAALILAASLMGAGAYAQDAGMGADMGKAGPMGGMMQAFADMDADKDGKVTKDEIAAFKAARFAEADANKDGKLSGDEMETAREAMVAKQKAARVAQMVKRLDKDGDGLISEAEMPSPPNVDKMFERLDSDKDGAISQAELDAAQKMMQDRMGERGGERHGKGGHDRHDDGHGKGKGGHDRGGDHGKGGFWGMFGDDNAPDDGPDGPEADGQGN